MLELNYTYLPCNFCVGKNHCEDCARDVCNMLEGLPGVVSAAARVDKEHKTLFIELAPGADEGEIYDALETVGVFA